MTKLKIGPDKHGNIALCENGKVVYYGAEKAAPVFEATESIDADDAEILPGWVCAHTHIYSALCPYGLPAAKPAPETFLQILERVWWRLDRAIDKDILRASARVYTAECLLQGTTSIVDHHESPNFIEGSLDVIADAIDEFGARAVLCYGATDRNYENEGKRGIDECVRFVKENKRPLVIGTMGLHAQFTCNDDTVKYCGDKARETNSIIQVHVAEGASDVDDAQNRGYSSPIDRLEKLGCMTKDSIYIHCIHMSEEETRHGADLGLWYVQNPRSNNGNQVGWPYNLRYAQKVALGVDGWSGDMIVERDCGRKLAVENGDDPVNIDHRLYSGWRMMSDLFHANFGPLNAADGKRASTNAVADLRIVDAQGVKHTVVNGEVVVKDRKLVHGDIDQLRKEAQEQANRLWERMAQYPVV